MKELLREKKLLDREIIAIFKEAKVCKKCYGKTHLCVPLPDEKNGGIGAKILFINERPGRRGAGKSGRISFDNEDPTARFFKELFLSISISRKDIFITNAVLCYPLFEWWVDTPPQRKQIKNCFPFLKRQIRIIHPKLIVTLGVTALQAVKYLFPNSTQLKNFKLKNDIGGVITDVTPFVYLLYHTSSRARVTRPKQKQKEDWQKIPVILEDIEVKKYPCGLEE
ncbi:MAG: uracil-DNA glycosylase family protein [Candidatus Aerophobetes bacterium]|nr:uracil-DNA glycosylase family protein [Candidatus Aerophobetes bacterium]